MLTHALRPARGGALGVILVFSFLLMLASHAGMAGLPLSLILFSWFFKYCYLLFDATVHGFDDPPVLDITKMNPLDEQRPLGQLIIGGLAFVAIQASHYFGPWATALLSGFMCVLLPACIAVLGLEGNLIKALNPVAWVQIAWHLKWLYALIWAAAGLYMAGLAALGATDVWLLLQGIANQFAILSLFSLLAGALYERRHELGLAVRHAPELDAEEAHREALKVDEKLLMDAYGLARSDQHTKSWALLQAFLTAKQHHPDSYAWACQRVTTWGDPRYITRLTEEWVERLLSLKKAGAALDVAAARLLLDPKFRPKTAAATLEIAQLAARGGGRIKLARTLLGDFAARFPGDSRTAAAHNLAGHLNP